MRKDFLEFIFDDDVDSLIGKNLPDPDLLDFYRFQKNREIYINEVIDTPIVTYALNIIKWNKEDKDIPIEDRKPIKIFVNSDGGCLNSIMMLIDAIKLSKTPVYTIGLGKAYSSGGLLLMSGHAGKRLLFPNTTVLIHDGSTGAMGNTGKVIDNLEFTKAYEERIKKYIICATKITEKQFKANYRKDWWIFAEEALALGIADKMINSLDEVF
jgi:ATP-dependent Clp protease protease subunit